MSTALLHHILSKRAQAAVVPPASAPAPAPAVPLKPLGAAEKAALFMPRRVAKRAAAVGAPAMTSGGFTNAVPKAKPVAMPAAKPAAPVGAWNEPIKLDPQALDAADQQRQMAQAPAAPAHYPMPVAPQMPELPGTPAPTTRALGGGLAAYLSRHSPLAARAAAGFQAATPPSRLAQLLRR